MAVTARRTGACGALLALVGLTAAVLRSRSALALASGACLFGAVSASPVYAATTTNYEATDERIANPERGFYHHTDDCDKQLFTKPALVKYRIDEKVNLVMCIFYLAEFKTSAISQAQLDRFERQASRVRKAGLKMVLRFAYTQSDEGDDATLSRIRRHINQLAPYLRTNADVIAVVQSGFVGAWGEGYYTQHFGDEGVVSPAQWQARKAVVRKLLSVLPAGRKVQVRTPAMKTQFYGSAATTASDIASGAEIGRVGHHNDCFLASDDDIGTYQDPVAEYPYLALDTERVPMGGETCGKKANPPRSNCPTARDELGKFHYSYLNIDYSQKVLDTWIAGGCMAEVHRLLGYRFSLVSVTSATTVRRGAKLSFGLTIHNGGWSAAINHRPVWLVLRHSTTGAVHKISFTKAKTWGAGMTVSRHRLLNIPTTIPAGTYRMFLSLPDPAPSLAGRPAYAIRLANPGLWERSTGYNRLRRSVTVM